MIGASHLPPLPSGALADLERLRDWLNAVIAALTAIADRERAVMAREAVCDAKDAELARRSERARPRHGRARGQTQGCDCEAGSSRA